MDGAEADRRIDVDLYLFLADINCPSVALKTFDFHHRRQGREITIKFYLVRHRMDLSRQNGLTDFLPCPVHDFLIPAIKIRQFANLIQQMPGGNHIPVAGLQRVLNGIFGEILAGFRILHIFSGREEELFAFITAGFPELLPVITVTEFIFIGFTA